MESYNTNISASVPAAVPQQQAQVKVELKEGMWVKAIDPCIATWHDNKPCLTVDKWYEIILLSDSCLEVDNDLGHGHYIDLMEAGKYFDLTSPRFPESSEAKEGERTWSDEDMKRAYTEGQQNMLDYQTNSNCRYIHAEEFLSEYSQTKA